MLDLVSETEPRVERLGVEEAPPTARKPRRPSASPNPPPSDVDLKVNVADSYAIQTAQHVFEQVERPPLVASPPTLATGEILRVAAMVLSARALVLVFGLCAFVIALVAVVHESREALYVLVAWALLTVIPAITLEIVTVLRRREE
jgi:hypothetical protein